MLHSIICGTGDGVNGRCISIKGTSISIISHAGPVEISSPLSETGSLAGRVGGGHWRQGGHREFAEHSHHLDAGVTKITPFPST